MFDYERFKVKDQNSKLASQALERGMPSFVSLHKPYP